MAEDHPNHHRPDAERITAAFDHLRATATVGDWPSGHDLRRSALHRRDRRRRVRIGTTTAVVVVSAVVLVTTLTPTGPGPGGGPDGSAGHVAARIGSAFELTAAHRATGGPAGGDAATAATAEQSFSLSLLRHLVADGSTTNQVASPYSLEAVLLMLEQGARGATAAQIANALDRAGVPPRRQAADWAALSADLRQAAAADHVALQDAGSVWVQKGLPLVPGYLSLLQRYFQSGTWNVDFHHRPAAALSAINAWASRATHGHVPHLLSPGDFDQYTVVALLNAVYFRAQWRDQFAKPAPGVFFAPSGAVATPFLTPKGNETLDAYVDEGIDAVQIPYWRASHDPASPGGRYAALVVMPTSGTLSQWVGGLTPASWQDLVGRLTPKGVDLTLPTFSLDTSAPLKQTLQALGITDAFAAGRADFSGISPANTYVMGVKQQATLAVTRWGTVATAATAAIMEATSLHSQVQIHVDRPFLFVIRDTTTGAILFAATVDDPAT